MDFYVNLKKKYEYFALAQYSHSFCFSTRSRGRTGTILLSLVFETNASTNSAIRAIYQTTVIYKSANHFGVYPPIAIGAAILAIYLENDCKYTKNYSIKSIFFIIIFTALFAAFIISVPYLIHTACSFPLHLFLAALSF